MKEVKNFNTLLKEVKKNIEKYDNLGLIKHL